MVERPPLPDAEPPRPPRREKRTTRESAQTGLDAELRQERLAETSHVVASRRARVFGIARELVTVSADDLEQTYAALSADAEPQREALDLMRLWSEQDQADLPPEAAKLVRDAAKERVGQFGREDRDPPLPADPVLAVAEKGVRLRSYVRMAELLRERLADDDDLEAIRAFVGNLAERANVAERAWLQDMEGPVDHREGEQGNVEKLAAQLDELDADDQAAILDVVATSADAPPANAAAAQEALLARPDGLQLQQLVERYRTAVLWEATTKRVIEAARTNMHTLRELRPRIDALRKAFPPEELTGDDRAAE
jgi:hypothetical protein